MTILVTREDTAKKKLGRGQVLALEPRITVHHGTSVYMARNKVIHRLGMNIEVYDLYIVWTFS
jgi:hypothetical protein